MRRLIPIAVAAATLFVTVPLASAQAATAGPVVSPSTPTGMTGYTKKWSDEFDTLNTTEWYVADGPKNNGVISKASNVRVSGGVLQTALGDTDGVKDSSGKLQPETGAHLYTKIQMLDVGEVAEFRAKFHTTTDGTGKFRSWTAVWVSGNPWPQAGEVDTAEVLGGQMTTNYHYLANGVHTQDQSGPKSFAAGKDQWATYSVERTTTSYVVRWNGAVVKTFADKDGTTPQNLLITAGDGSGDLFGFANTPLEVDYAAVYGK